jgi:glycosyltransferase involved in cell wall biosynthesis
MKILQINKYHYLRGGSDTVYFNTGKLLMERGHSVLNFAMEYPENESSNEAEFFAENKDFVTLPLKKKVRNVPSFFYNKEAAIKLRILIRHERPDVAHLHIFYGSLTSSILQVLKEENIPAVVSVHDYKFICPAYLLLDGKNEVCERCKGHNFMMAVRHKCVKDSYLFSTFFALESYYRDRKFPLEKMFSKMIFVSRFSRDIHTKYKHELKKISTHLYNFDPNVLRKNPHQQKGEYFLYAGRLSKEKGLPTLLDAFADLSDVTLKVAGTGEHLSTLKNRASSNVEFVGFKKGDELKNLIAHASFILVPSEWYENNPMAIIEAYGLGKPVIAANIGGIPEIVEEDKTGFLFEAGNVKELKEKIIAASLIDSIKYIEMSRAAVEFAHEHFNPNSHYNRLIEIYKEVLTP